MRFVVFFLVAACSNDTDLKVATLQRQVDELQAKLDQVQLTPGPKGDRGDPGPTGDPATATKVPHLVVVATGEDLGISLGSYGAALTVGIGMITYTQPIAVAYESADCSGPGYLELGFADGLQGWHMLAISGSGQAADIVAMRDLDTQYTSIMRRSHRVSTPDGACLSLPPASASVIGFKSTGARGHWYKLNELTYELR